MLALHLRSTRVSQYLRAPELTARHAAPPARAVETLIVAGCSQIWLISEPQNEKKKTAGFLRAKEKAFKYRGCNLNRACSSLTMPGWGHCAVWPRWAASAVEQRAAKCCVLSLYLSSTEKSTAYVALTHIHQYTPVPDRKWLKKYINKEWLSTYHFFCLSYCWYITEDAECRRGQDPNKVRFIYFFAANNSTSFYTMSDTVTEPSVQLSVLHTLFDRPLKHSHHP